jgi:hypothetical protein
MTTEPPRWLVRTNDLNEDRDERQVDWLWSWADTPELAARAVADDLDLQGDEDPGTKLMVDVYPVPAGQHGLSRVGFPTAEFAVDGVEETREADGEEYVEVVAVVRPWTSEDTDEHFPRYD